MLFVSDSQVKAPRIESGSVCKRIVAKPSSIWRFWLWSLGASSSCEHTRLFCLHASESWVVWIWTVFPADCFWVLRNFEPQCPACKLPRLLRSQPVPSQSPEPKSWAMERTEHAFLLGELIEASRWPNNGSPRFSLADSDMLHLNHFHPAKQFRNFRQSIMAKLLDDRMAFQSRVAPCRRVPSLLCLGIMSLERLVVVGPWMSMDC